MALIDRIIRVTPAIALVGMGTSAMAVLLGPEADAVAASVGDAIFALAVVMVLWNIASVVDATARNRLAFGRIGDWNLFGLRGYRPGLVALTVLGMLEVVWLQDRGADGQGASVFPTFASVFLLIAMLQRTRRWRRTPDQSAGDSGDGSDYY